MLCLEVFLTAGNRSLDNQAFLPNRLAICTSVQQIESSTVNPRHHDWSKSHIRFWIAKLELFLRGLQDDYESLSIATGRWFQDDSLTTRDYWHYGRSTFVGSVRSLLKEASVRFGHMCLRILHRSTTSKRSVERESNADCSFTVETKKAF